LEASKTIYQPIIKAFLPNVQTFSIQPITDGLINATFKVILPDKPDRNYILQQINTQVFQQPENIHTNITLVNQHLKAKKYPHPVLELLQTETGKYSFVYEGATWRMFCAIEDSFTINVVQNPNQAFEVGAFIGEFYQYLNGIETEKIEMVLPHFLDMQSRIDAFHSALSHAKEERKLKSKEQIEWVLEHQDLPKKWIELQKTNALPVRLIHADPKISNVLFDVMTNQPKAIIDWDTLMLGTILYDYGDMIRSYTNTKSEDDPNPENVFSQPIYEAITRGFLSNTASFLTPLETQNLAYAPQVIVYIQVLRFLTDYLNGDLYYHCTYPEQNLNRVKNQIHLLQGILQI
jgi:Ser/Thr protein kinase RdoA (MazF antagonist)